METKRCPSCGAVLSPTKKIYQVCSYCGAEVYFDENAKELKAKKIRRVIIFVLVSLLLIAGIVAYMVLFQNKTNNIETTDYNVYRINNVTKIRTGDHLLFGTYEQDNNINTTDEIEWIVIKNDGEQLTLESNSGLDVVNFKNIEEWLKSDLTKEFSDEEKRYVVETKILNSKEIEKYFESEEERECKATPYAVSNGANIDNNKNVCWWVDTTDLSQGPRYVSVDGRLEYTYTNSDKDGYVARPTIIINKYPKQEEVKEEKQETSQVKYITPIIEVLDKQMNVYSTVNKKSTKNGIVYQGDRFECLAYYETPGYKWYQIGTNQWLGDGNDTRIRLVEGTLAQVTVDMN